MRGVIPAFMLAELEAAADRPARELFDLIAGTSTGGILALGLTAPVEGRFHSARSLMAFYQDWGTTVFKRSALQRLPLPINAVPYEPQGLKSVLRHYFKTVHLHDAAVPVLVPAYDLDRRKPFWFRSWDPSCSFRMTEVALAASAAPTYFPPVRLHRASGRKSEYTFIDGGIFANNPTLTAIEEARRLYPDKNSIVVVSLGTGDVSRGASRDEIDWSIVDWVKQLVPTVFDAISDNVDAVLESQLGRTDYWRIQVDIAQAGAVLDATDSDAINGWLSAARRRRDALGDEYLARLVARLTP